jgi:predicted translin family RNA/ssDNA-binding protein
MNNIIKYFLNKIKLHDKIDKKNSIDIFQEINIQKQFYIDGLIKTFGINTELMFLISQLNNIYDLDELKNTYNIIIQKQFYINKLIETFGNIEISFLKSQFDNIYDLDELKNAYNIMIDYYNSINLIIKENPLQHKKIIDILTSNEPPLFNHNYVENLIKQNNE